MLNDRIDRTRLVRVLTAALLLCAAGEATRAFGQSGPRGPSPTPRPAGTARQRVGPQFELSGPKIPVREIRIIGNRRVKQSKVRSYLQTRVGRNFDPVVLESDVRRLTESRLFRDIRTFTREMDGALSVTIEVFERPTIAYIKTVGNSMYSDEFLAEKSGLKPGEGLNIYSIDAAASRVEDYYRSKGFSEARVSVLEGNQPGDEGVVFVVHEGVKARIWGVEFVGNEVVSGRRLETLVQSKPGYMKYFIRGAVNRKMIDEDVQRLTAYYRRLGYFHARVGREIEMSDAGDWATLTFVIDEGPRYQVRQVSFLGNEKFNDEQLAGQLQLKDGELYNMSKMAADLKVIRDLYGSKGYIFADIQADPRFFEEPGQLDLVYNIKEGDQFRVGEIRVHIGGRNPHTKKSVVLNRLSFAPGDIIDSRQIRDSERRLKFSQLFRNDPARQISPQIVVRPPSNDDLPGRIVSKPGAPRRAAGASGSDYRGQSPDDATWTRPLDIDIFVPDTQAEQLEETPRRLPPTEVDPAAGRQHPHHWTGERR